MQHVQKTFLLVSCSTNYYLGLDWYLDQMPAVTPSEVPFEKMPNYLHFPGATKRISESLPEVKLVLIFCEPGRRVMSDYLHRQRNNKTDGSFEVSAAWRSCS